THDIANDLSEEAVGGSCATSGVAHRFSIDVTAADVAAHPGEEIHVYGIAPPATFPNDPIRGSGDFSF
ncbi:MAG: hypothetical protein JRH20_11710, partial [Deltaproteobacteria bacterium]|nr:hypothetical protein [Deltaproteobacteria bacterium]